MLKINNLSCKIEGKTILNEIDFFTEPKTVLGIVGPSGSGKTTLLRNIAGLVNPKQGQILIDDNVLNNTPVAKRSISFLQQSFPLYNQLTVLENILVSCERVRKHNLDKAKEYLKNFLIREDIWNRKPENLSGGEQQRIALAKALLKPSKLLLLDEPFSNLDKSLKNHISNILINHIKENDKICLYVTHDENEIIINSDKLIVLEEGKLIQKGTPEELIMNPYNSNIASLGNPLGLQSVNVSFIDMVSFDNLSKEVYKIAWHSHKSKIIENKSIDNNSNNDFLMPSQIIQVKKAANKVLYALRPLGKDNKIHVIIWHESKSLENHYALNQNITLRISKNDIIKLDNNNKVIR